MNRQTLHDWVHRFNEAGADGLLDKWSSGPQSRLSQEQFAELAEIVETGPDPISDGVVRWRRIDLQRVIRESFGVEYHERHVSTLLKKLGFPHMSARPRHPAQDGEIVEAFKKNFQRTLKAHLAVLPKGKPIEIWFQDDARIGQKNGIVRQWARRGTRPRQSADQRYKNAYLFGAICPARGTGAALALPYADTNAMQLHLDEISRHVARGAHAVVLMDRAGWHTTSKLDVPRNITSILLPSRAPELNPVKNIWQYLCANWLSNRVFGHLRRHHRRGMRGMGEADRPAGGHQIHRDTKVGPHRSKAMTIGMTGPPVPPFGRARKSRGTLPEESRIGTCFLKPSPASGNA